MAEQDQQAEPGRRPLKSRSTGWAGMATRVLLKTSITPNQISLIGIGFAALGAWAFYQIVTGAAWWWLIAALCIQLRLLSNMLDGMVAVEGGRGHPTGALFNELPDRVQDVLLLGAAGIAAGSTALGLTTALLAVLCAYVRVTGVSLGLPADFRGPMAKPHRMAALTLGSLLAFGCAIYGANVPVLFWTLVIIAIGTAGTVARRTLRMHALLSAKTP